MRWVLICVAFYEVLKPTGDVKMQGANVTRVIESSKESECQEFKDRLTATFEAAGGVNIRLFVVQETR